MHRALGSISPQDYTSQERRFTPRVAVRRERCSQEDQQFSIILHNYTEFKASLKNSKIKPLQIVTTIRIFVLQFLTLIFDNIYKIFEQHLGQSEPSI